jgi:hypothetical protein
MAYEREAKFEETQLAYEYIDQLILRQYRLDSSHARLGRQYDQTNAPLATVRLSRLRPRNHPIIRVWSKLSKRDDLFLDVFCNQS